MTQLENSLETLKEELDCIEDVIDLMQSEMPLNNDFEDI